MKKSKTQEWADVRKALKVKFSSWGIEHCELRYEGCWVNSALGFAHSLPRRFITDRETLETVILACNSCHFILDNKYTHEETKNIVEDIIANRYGQY